MKSLTSTWISSLAYLSAAAQAAAALGPAAADQAAVLGPAAVAAAWDSRQTWPCESRQPFPRADSQAATFWNAMFAEIEPGNFGRSRFEGRPPV